MSGAGHVIVAGTNNGFGCLIGYRFPVQGVVSCQYNVNTVSVLCQKDCVSPVSPGAIDRAPQLRPRTAEIHRRAGRSRSNGRGAILNGETKLLLHPQIVLCSVRSPERFHKPFRQIPTWRLPEISSLNSTMVLTMRCALGGSRSGLIRGHARLKLLSLFRKPV